MPVAPSVFLKQFLDFKKAIWWINCYKYNPTRYTPYFIDILQHIISILPIFLQDLIQINHNKLQQLSLVTLHLNPHLNPVSCTSPVPLSCPLQLSLPRQDNGIPANRFLSVGHAGLCNWRGVSYAGQWRKGASPSSRLCANVCGGINRKEKCYLRRTAAVGSHLSLVCWGRCLSKTRGTDGVNIEKGDLIMGMVSSNLSDMSCGSASGNAFC